MVLILPAMGVRASFYKDFAEELANKGMHAVTADWRGFGESNVKISRNNNHGYKELIEELSQMMDLLSKHFPNAKKFILGHSLGGQVGALYASKNPGKLDGLILVASCMVYYRVWGSRAGQVQIAGRVFPILSALFGYFPGHKIGFAGKEARGVIKDWCRNALKGIYRPDGDDFDYETALKELNIPVLSISFDKDSLALKSACQALYQKLNPESPVKHVHLTEENTKLRPLNHFAWAKKPVVTAKLAKDWIAREF